MVDRSDYKDAPHVDEADRRRHRRKQHQPSVYIDGSRVAAPRGRETAQHVPHMFTRDDEPRARRRRKPKEDQPLGRKTEVVSGLMKTPVSGITKAALCYV